MEKLKTLDKSKFNGLKVVHYPEHFHDSNNEPIFYEAVHLGGWLLDNDHTSVSMRYAFEEGFGENGNDEIQGIVDTANEAGGIYTVEDVKALDEMFKAAKTKPIFSNTHVVSQPKAGITDYENYLYEMVKNRAIGDFIPEEIQQNYKPRKKQTIFGMTEEEIDQLAGMTEEDIINIADQNV
jgi:hypothetical protein